MLVPSGTTPDADRGVYGITVAAELVGLEAQSLRLYEARGLLTPDRTGGGTRRYSANDLLRLRRIADLMATGVNLTGIRMLLDLQDENRSPAPGGGRPAASWFRELTATAPPRGLLRLVGALACQAMSRSRSSPVMAMMRRTAIGTLCSVSRRPPLRRVRCNVVRALSPRRRRRSRLRGR